MARVIRVTLEHTCLFRPVDRRPVLTVDRLELEAGLIYGLVGANLSGRSALLRRIGGGFLSRSADSDLGAARIEWDSPSRIEDLNPSQHSVYLGPNPQDSLSSLTSTVEEEIELHRRISGCARGHDPQSELSHLARSFRLDEALGQNAMQLSGGQTAALALICAVVMYRPIICIDEVLGHLDVGLRPRAWQILKEEARQGGVILVADNNYDLMAEHADRVILLSDLCVQSVEMPQVGFNMPAPRRWGAVPTATKLAAEVGIAGTQLPTRYAELRDRVAEKAVMKRRGPGSL